MRRLLALGILGLALAACTLTDPRVTIVDGWSIGPEAECAPQAGCEKLIDAATDALATGSPAHPSIERVSVHQEGFYPCRSGGGISQIFRSGGFPPIVLFVLAGGSRRAFGIDYTGPQFSLLVAQAHGPEVAPWSCSDSDVPAPHPTEAPPSR